jgi:hypothetical protein
MKAGNRSSAGWLIEGNLPCLLPIPSENSLRFSPKARDIADALFRSHGPQRALDQSRLATACGAHPSAKASSSDAKTAETGNGGTDIAAASQKTHQRPPYGLASLTQGPFRANPAVNRLIASKPLACYSAARGRARPRLAAPKLVAPVQG